MRLIDILGIFVCSRTSKDFQGGSTQPPEERYRSQLEQLTSMGFSNQEANIQGNFNT